MVEEGSNMIPKSEAVPELRSKKSERQATHHSNLRLKHRVAQDLGHLFPSRWVPGHPKLATCVYRSLTGRSGRVRHISSVKLIMKASSHIQIIDR